MLVFLTSSSPTPPSGQISKYKILVRSGVLTTRKEIYRLIVSCSNGQSQNQALLGPCLKLSGGCSQQALLVLLKNLDATCVTLKDTILEKVN